MENQILKSEIKCIEANTAESLTQAINDHLDEGWKLLLSSYQVWADQGQRGYSTLMTKERYYPEGVDDSEEA